MKISAKELNELLQKEYNRGFNDAINTNKQYVTTIDCSHYNIPEACKHCSCHPSNGGSGNCNCIFGSVTFSGNATGTTVSCNSDSVVFTY